MGCQSSFQKLKDWPDTSLVGAQQQDAGVGTRWIETDVTKPFVSRYQEALLGLNRQPQWVVFYTAHPLLNHALCLVAAIS